MKRILQIIVTALLLSTLNFQLSTVHAQGTAFTYQGRLNNGGAPANGSYDIAFTLFPANTGGFAIVPGPVTNSAVGVTNGLFTTTVDFGNVFTGGSNWLQIAVSTNGANAFSTLLPRQQLTPVPYAITAANVSGISIQQNSNGAPNVILGSSANFVSGGVVGATIGGGGATNYFGQPYTNSVTADYGSIGGGYGNTASGQASMVSGGVNNTASGIQAMVGGGYGNTASGQVSMVAGGVDNTASGLAATVAGGSANIANADNGTVGGGQQNTASGTNATVAGGYQNTASGNSSFAAGTSAKAINDGAFVWADSQSSGFSSTNNDSFNVLAHGGARFVTGGAGMSVDGSLTIAGVTSYNNGLKLTGSTTSGTGLAIENTASGGHKYDLISGGAGSAQGAGAFELYDESVVNGFRLTITTNGNVGIGTVAPTTALQVNGVVTANSFSGSAGGLTGLSATALNGTVADTNLSANVALLNRSTQNFTGGVNTFSGNVGIGTATPNSALSVYGNIFMGKQRNNTTFNQVGDTIYLGAEQKYLGNTLGTPVDGTTDWINLMANSLSAGIIFGLSTSTANPHSNNIPLMVIRSNGNVGIAATNPAHLFVVGSSVSPAYCDGTTWVNGSDRNSKEDFSAINPAEVLQKVAAMPMTKWQYKVAPGQEHIGPMAQDFHEAFGLNGSDDKHISTVDEGGVALAAIQGLNQKLQSEAKAKDAEIQNLERKLDELQVTVKQLASKKLNL